MNGHPHQDLLSTPPQLRSAVYVLTGIGIPAQGAHMLTAHTNMFVPTVPKTPPSSTNFIRLSSVPITLLLGGEEETGLSIPQDRAKDPIEISC